MLNQILGKKVIPQNKDWMIEMMIGFEMIVIDLGCGDGKWAYRFAQDNLKSLVIGIDADAVSLEKVSHKASRKPAKGGVANLIFLKSFGEDLPQELTGVADEIYINFPWGSLLAGVMNGQSDFLNSISKLAKSDCILHLTTTYDKKYEPQMIEQLSLPELHQELEVSLQKAWLEYGWNLVFWQKLGSTDVTSIPQTAWWKQISAEREREVWKLDLNRKMGYK